jgi:hypothetical protein
LRQQIGNATDLQDTTSNLSYHPCLFVAGMITTQGLPYAQLMVASAVAIDVAIVATHFNTEIKTFFVTFILFFFNYGFY